MAQPDTMSDPAAWLYLRDQRPAHIDGDVVDKELLRTLFIVVQLDNLQDRRVTFAAGARTVAVHELFAEAQRMPTAYDKLTVLADIVAVLNALNANTVAEWASNKTSGVAIRFAVIRRVAARPDPTTIARAQWIQ